MSIRNVPVEVVSVRYVMRVESLTANGKRRLELRQIPVLNQKECDVLFELFDKWDTRCMINHGDGHFGDWVEFLQKQQDLIKNQRGVFGFNS